MGVVHRAAKFLRKCIAAFISGRKTEFQGSVKSGITDIPATLQSFLMWILNGAQLCTTPHHIGIGLA